MNRQVPKKYTIVGDGKVARHLAQYFTLVGIEFNQWNHKQKITQLQLSVAASDCVLILISDDVIQKFINQYAFLKDKTLIHFSGSLVIDKAYGCHPLMTFGQDLYDLSTYQSIPFICDEHVKFKTLFPKLNNKALKLPHNQKAFYHAMCVIAGNFTQTLMRATSEQLEENCDLPTDILFPYLLQNTKNFINNPRHSATGPMHRGDFTTVQKNLQVLQGNDLEEVYKSFLKYSTNTSSPLHSLNDPNEYLELKKNESTFGFIPAQ